MAHPKIVDRDEWLAARKQLLEEEKELTRRRDALSAKRRRLPMVSLDKQYVFEGAGGRATLLDLFDGRSQLIVYHFMFDPGDPPPGKSGAPWEEGCTGCSFVLDNLGHLSHLHARDTSLVVVSRAPLGKIEPFQKRMGWTLPWYSSFGSDFNYDFQVTQEDKGEQPGLSVFLRDANGTGVFHTYSTYARGLDSLLTTYGYLDLTPYGRQEAWEDSPEGWPQTATHLWLRHHDKYDDEYNERPRLAHSCCSST